MDGTTIPGYGAKIAVTRHPEGFDKGCEGASRHAFVLNLPSGDHEPELKILLQQCGVV